MTKIVVDEPAVRRYGNTSTLEEQVVSTDRRQSGGQSNKRGSRYEDYYIVYRILESLPLILEQSQVIRVKEQAACPVDDVVIESQSRVLYHQLKSSDTITWGQDDGKLEREFRDQQHLCAVDPRTSRLYLVVPTDKRAELLRFAMPDDLKPITEIMQFPLLKRPSELVHLKDRLAAAFDSIRASRFASRTTDEATAGAILLAYAEHVPDEEGYCSLIQLVQTVRSRKLVALRACVTITEPGWPTAESILRRIDRLQWWTDRGYFEWSYGEAERGILADDVASDTFTRFVNRLIASQPTTFDAFEEALP